MNRPARRSRRPAGILVEILEHKRAEVADRRRKRSLEEVRRAAESTPSARGFAQALSDHRPAVIAEIKRASPSEGVIRPDFDPAALAESYQRAGAACLSVLTDERFFMGSDAHLGQARGAVGLPILRKDFTIDPYQLYEARALGADCVLLIASAVEAMRLAELGELAGELAMDVLIEVHDRTELESALALNPKLVGINNRDLRTFETRLDTTLELLADIPGEVIVVTESGIHTPEDVRRLRAAGVEAFLVGTAFMREADPGNALRRLFAPGKDDAGDH
ncbi:MAG: indole-3-glycerol phosphate synthase TrpC [Gammaproteobacteria bacterium]|nr:indole-3-glycerol phosphate synthase TrpC [Gammaproteobacteria bacterium]